MSEGGNKHLFNFGKRKTNNNLKPHPSSQLVKNETIKICMKSMEDK